MLTKNITIEVHPQLLGFDSWFDYVAQVGLKGEILEYRNIVSCLGR